RSGSEPVIDREERCRRRAGSADEEVHGVDPGPARPHESPDRRPAGPHQYRSGEVANHRGSRGRPPRGGRDHRCVRELARSKGITLAASDTPPDPLEAPFDYGRVVQVLANLLSNAIKFTPAGGRIGVRVTRKDA